MTLRITSDRSGDVVVLRLAGELDMATVPTLTAAIDESLTAGEHRLVLDLGGLTFCDSSGIASFVRGDNECAGRGGWLRLTGFVGAVERVLVVTGLVEVLGHDPAADRPASVPE